MRQNWRKYEPGERQEQAARLCSAHPGMAAEPKGLLGKLIAEVARGDLNQAFFTLGGAESRL